VSLSPKQSSHITTPLAAPTAIWQVIGFLSRTLSGSAGSLRTRKLGETGLFSLLFFSTLGDDPASPSRCYRRRGGHGVTWIWRTGGTAERLRVLGDHMKNFYIRRGQSVEEHGIIDEGPGKHPDGVGHLSEHREVRRGRKCEASAQRHHGRGRVLSTGWPQVSLEIDR
jgi:hypothetical protein